MKKLEDYFSSEMRNAISVAAAIAKENFSSKIFPPHLLSGLLHRDTGLKSLLFENGIDVFYLEEWADVKIESCQKTSKPDANPDLSEEVEAIFDEAIEIAAQNESEILKPIFVLASLATPGVGFTYDELKTFPVRPGILLTNSNVNQDNTSSKTSKKPDSKTICEYLTLIAQQSINNPTILGREQELFDVLEIIGRHQKPHVILTGENGVGKSAMIYGLAFLLNEGKSSDLFNESNIYQLDTNKIFSGVTYKGELEERLRKVFSFLTGLSRPILFIDEIQILLDDQQNGKGIAYLLKSELSKGSVVIIATATNEVYRKDIERNNLINRYFDRYNLNEPTSEKATEMVISKVKSLSEHHNVTITNEVVKEAVDLAKRHLTERSLPDSAIGLIDRTMAAIRSQLDCINPELDAIELKLEDKDANLSIIYDQLKVLQKYAGIDKEDTQELSLAHCKNQLIMLSDYINEKENTVQKLDLANTVGRIKNIPAGKIMTKERDRLLTMEEEIQKLVIGQDSGVSTICESILESRSGLNKPGLPIGSFFLLGPTGTGKTELAKQLANYLFQTQDALIRFDMSEFKEEHSAALLYGAPPGYVGYEEGGMLVNKIRQKPYAVVLFDEIEKAHPSVFDIFLQILDEGKLNDRLGKVGDFSNAVILFTSNIGSKTIVNQFNQQNTLPDQATLMESMAMHFRPEFLGRLTGLVPFAPITEASITKIFDIQITELNQLLTNQGINLEIEEEARTILAKEGFNPEYGARPLRGVIRNRLRTPLSKLIISQKLKEGNTVHVIVNKDHEIELKIVTIHTAIAEKQEAKQLI